VIGFEGIGATAKTQFEMVVGEFPWDNTAGLATSTTVIFLLYVCIFAIFAYFILLNFFLAIVVQAFQQVKEDQRLSVVENTCCNDVCDIVNTTVFEVLQGIGKKF